MSEETPNLGLPYILPSQAQKHVTHNEAIRALDALVQLGVLTQHMVAPPAEPDEGERHIVGAPAIEAWENREGQIAAFQDGAWAFMRPTTGWVAYVAQDDAMLVHDGSVWKPMPVEFMPSQLQNLEGLGIAASFDAENKLAVSSDASLFSHEGAGHQVKINRKTGGDTSSILFQTNWSGRAEIGCAGDDALRVKVSPNGASWINAMHVDAATGHIGIGDVVPVRMLHMRGNNSNPRLDRDTNIAAFHIHCFPTGDYTTPWKGFVFGVDAQSAGVGRFVIADYGTQVTGPSINRLSVENNGDIAPGGDDAQALGTPARRWTQVYAASATINTSDERVKTEIGDVPDSWLDAWGEVQWSRFRFTAARLKKGEAARWHVGLVAQHIRDVFAAHGLDAFTLGLLCHDAWEAEHEGENVETPDVGEPCLMPNVAEAGDRFGIRYEEALAMEAAWLRREMQRMTGSLPE